MLTEVTQLQHRIAQLEKEVEQLRSGAAFTLQGPTVKVPPQMKPLFDIAQRTVSDYFTDLKMQPDRGTIEINDQRYILIRASAMSKDFLDTIQNLYADRGKAEAMSIGKNFLFDIAHTLGINDAKNFHATMKLTDPIAKLSAGPVHFAFTGWAFVDILPESSPTPDDNFYLIYNHPYSFEADSWIKAGRISDTAVCIMSAGYSSGWCEESFGIPLTAVEVKCTAKGDDCCTFIMSPPHKIHQHLDTFHLHNENKPVKQQHYEIPTFFERKKIEEELQRSRLHAEESAQAKEDFVANMSHELRTPLGSILGFTELLEKTNTDALQREYIDAIGSSGKSLLSIINDILDLSKLDAGRFAVEDIPFNITDVLYSVKNMFSEKAKNKGLAFAVKTATKINYTVYGDASRLTQILINLVGNAVKFTETGSINLICTIERTDEAWANVHFIITDTGIGIPSEKLDFIFERFTQADTNISRRFGGTGLGLAISKQLIELMGGNIMVKSEPAAGTTFSFSLSFRKATEVPLRCELQEHIGIENSVNKTILVVEDNLLNQKLTGIILKNNGFNFLLAGNGLEAIKVLEEYAPDLILMDIQMPVMDGYEATCHIRDKMHLNIPIVAITAHALTGEKEKCIEKGIDGYLPKPFSEAALIKTISLWINKNRSSEKKGEKKVTDLNFLKKQTRHNVAVIKEMIAFFIDQNPREVKDLYEAITSLDYTSVHKKVHTLKNNIALFGIDKWLETDLLQMEEAVLKKFPMDEIKKYFKQIETCCSKAIEELKNEVI